ncbi:VOC family protein [Fulvivirga sp.]|uniref:VOC family protein n=1 Tax=Fulvivirga sp. TaxID=1931237 RepID=UPI0032EE6C7A
MPFNINFLDHVAIRVKDLEASVKWYEEVPSTASLAQRNLWLFQIQPFKGLLAWCR